MNQTSFKFEIDFDDEDLSKTIYDAVVVETQDKELRRGTVQIEVKGSILFTVIQADDIVAARSIFNSLMRVVKTSFDVAKILESKE